MKIIGITGGVGAGKSEILKYLKEKHQAVIVETDKVGHFLMEPDGACYGEIVKIFGRDILNADLTIDRGRLGKIVFNDPILLQKLNGIIHPNVKKWIINEIMMQKACDKTELFVIESALLLDDHYEEICDEIWYIDADIKTRTERLKKSRGYSDEKISEIMKNQKTADEFRQLCGVIIVNDGVLADTFEQIDKQLGR